MIPPFVYFENEDDPNTAKLISLDGFSEVIGEGYRLKGVFVSLSSGDVNRQALDRIPWAKNLVGELDGVKRNSIKVGSTDVRTYMSKEYFYRESKQ